MAAASFWPFRIRIDVEWRDLDAAGHVNNAVYLSYMETARVRAYFALTGGQAAKDLDIILARATVDFRSPATLGETIEVEVRPGRVGETSFVLAYTLRDAASGRIVAEGESVLVSFDYARQTKRPVPDALRARLLAR